MLKHKSLTISLSFCVILTLILIILKLVNIISLAWVIVFLPFYLPFFAAIFFYLLNKFFNIGPKIRFK